MQNLRQVLINDADYEHQLEKDEDMNQTPYDPYQCPPDLQEAEDHSKSRRVGQIKQGTRTCKCCRFVIDKKQLGLCCREKDLSFLGSGYPLYFRISKYFCIILIYLFIFCGLPSLYLNYMHQTEQSIYLYGVIIFEPNKAQKFIDQKNYINLLTSLVLIFLISYYEPKIKQDAAKYNVNYSNPSNYSLLVQNLPRHLSKKEIDEFLKISFFGDPLTDQIYRINMCYDYQEYLDSFNQKIKNIYATNICKLKLRDQYLEEPYAQETQDKLESLEQEQQVIDQKLMNFEHECLQERSKKFSGTVIVSFLTIQAKETILNKYKFTLKKTILNFFKKVYLRYHKNSIIINEAPGPRDVIWANLKYKLNQSISNLIKMFSMFVFLLVVSYYVQIQVLYKTLIYHELYNDGEQIVDKNYRLVQLAMAIAFLVLIINWVLRYIVGYFCWLIRPPSYSQYNKNYIFLYVIVSLFNGAFLPYIVIKDKSNLQDVQTLLKYQAHFILLFQSIKHILQKLINIEYFYKIYKRWDIKRYPQKDCPYSQEEVNVSFEGPKLEFQEWVCSLIRIMVQTVWFGGIAPIQILISLLCILIGYWIDKYYLLRIFTVPISQTDHVFSFVFNLLKLIPILYYFGSIQFEQAISQEQNTLTFFKNYPEYLYCFLTSVVFTFLMYLYIQQKDENLYDLEDENPYQYNYEQASLYFRQDYHQCNPINVYSSIKNHSFKKNKIHNFAQLLSQQYRMSKFDSFSRSLIKKTKGVKSQFSVQMFLQNQNHNVPNQIYYNDQGQELMEIKRSNNR